MVLEILVGPIASGKSTYCKIAAQEGGIIVNDDSIVSSLHADNYQLYKPKLKPLYKAVENTIIQTALVMGCRVVVDRPNHTIAMRRRYIGLGHSFDASVKVVLFRRWEPSVHALRRYKGDNRGYGYDYWLRVANFHESQYQLPRQEIENFDEEFCWLFYDKE